MKFKTLFITGIGLLLAAALAIMSIGCSSDSSSPTGPDRSPAQTYDEITVALNKLSVKYDCDYDPVGVTQPGDFRYTINVDTLTSDGSGWLPVTSYGEQSASISNGGYKNITGRSVSFRFPRVDGQAFRVKMSLREVDSDKNDFASTHNVTHIYSSASTQMYAPEGTNYSSWNSATHVGNMYWNVNKRDRSYVAGILTKEGCNATLNYSVTVREAD